MYKSFGAIVYYCIMRKITKFKSSGEFERIDHDEKVIRGVTLIEGDREATGHGVYIDMKMIRSVTKQGKESGDLGLKARYDHPSACFSSMGSQLGRLKNFRTTGNKSVADLHIGEFTKHSPHGDIGKWLLSVAETDPSQVGFSICFIEDEPEDYSPGEDDDPDSPEFTLPHARLHTLTGADVVDEGAATESLFEKGIMGRPDYLAEQAQRWLEEKDELVRKVFEPLVTKIIKNMSDKKTFTDEVKDLFKKHFGSDEPETPDNQDEIDALKADIETYKTEADTAKAEIERLTTEAEEAKVDADQKENTFNEKIDELTREIEALKAEPIGDTIEPITDGQDIDTSEEAEEERKAANHQEDIFAWADEGFINE